ncbi:DNA recombination protein RmuC [Desulfopila sp. IMCC35006]|uniref:DNA recombination protein RmuC n=1 Tax=Desulfopila sp. IMCC35006 TaxID=2569542 RepID=UPI0010ACBD8C|nr:DNA recombination protein RmuC [Desulfopila sp. IMCC35006]TKB24436.1 DNA recombination protein RmuC [Desulfopila sp. IMCC35006]
MTEFARALILFLQGFLPQNIDLPSLVLLLTMATLLLGLVCLLLTGKISRLIRQRQNLTLALATTEKKAADALEQYNRQTIREAKLITLLTNERKHAAEKLQLLENAREELKLQFAGLAQQIFDEKSARFSELNREKLDAILQPFNSQLTALKQEINDIYRHDSRERFSLKSEIVQLRDLNLQVNREAVNLTNALKGDTKIQGNWGELVLERVLEKSGLRRGLEYDTQGGFRDNSNRLLKPDVIVHLPENKDIIIDSKVSLVSWEKYVNTDDENEQQRHLAAMQKAIREHIATLSQKNYPELAGIHSLDFILMFMPIEAAFSTAFAQDDTLFLEALSKNIIIVTPTTLLAALRTIENIWQFEHQSNNAQEIARRAGIMYDKFRGFMEEMEKIGKQLATCHSTYDGALLKLTRGRGNLVAQAEQLKELGVQVKKEIPKSITDLAELDLKN